MRLPIGTIVKVYEHDIPAIAGYRIYSHRMESIGKITGYEVEKYRSYYWIDGSLADAFYCEVYDEKLAKMKNIKETEDKIAELQKQLSELRK